MRSPLRSQNVSFLVKIEGGFDENKFKKSRVEKTPVFKKTKIGYSVLGLRKPNFRTKTIPFDKKISIPKTVKGGPFRFFNIHSVAKFQKIEGGPSGVFQKNSNNKK